MRRWLFIWAAASSLSPHGVYAQSEKSGIMRRGSSTPFILDLNGDGRLDAVIISSSNSVGVLLGNGDGTFRRPIMYPVGQGPVSMECADVNNDGKMDLIVANSLSSNVSILLGNGDGSFQAPLNFETRPGPSAVIVADFDRDGKPDVAVAHAAGKLLSVMLGNGDGTFRSALELAVLNSPDHLIAQDYNRDGKLDLLISYSDSDTVSLLLGNGDGSFQPEMRFSYNSSIQTPSEASTVPAGTSGAAQAEPAPDNGFKHDSPGGSNSQIWEARLAGVRDASPKRVSRQQAASAIGGVLFNLNGTQTQDPANFVYDSLNQRIGLRTSVPTAGLHFGNIGGTVGESFMAVSPQDGSPPFFWNITGFPNAGDPSRMNQVVRFGWNLAFGGGQVYSKGAPARPILQALVPNQPAMGLEFESHYAPDPTNQYLEHHFAYVNTSGRVYRPMSWQINQTNDYILGGITSDKWNWFRASDGAQWMVFLPYELFLNGPTALEKTLNNSRWLLQMNNAGNGYVEIARVNASNEVVIGPAGAPIRMGSTVAFTGTSSVSIGPPSPGSMVWCQDCQVSSPCTGGGSGAWAFGVGGGSWSCPF